MPAATRVPPYRLILLPVDDSAASRDAARHLATLAPALGAAVAILAVMDTGGVLAFTLEAADVYTRLRARAEAAIDAASTIVRGAGVARVEHLIMDGVPATGIVETAAELGADMIVLGVATRDGAGTTLDATTATVIRDAPCPVLLAPSRGNGRR